MKEEYYIVPKKVLDDLVNLIETQLNFTINNNCKLIYLSDEAIEEKAKNYAELFRYDTDILSWFNAAKLPYKQALTDIKQQIKL